MNIVAPGNYRPTANACASVYKISLYVDLCVWIYRYICMYVICLQKVCMHYIYVCMYGNKFMFVRMYVCMYVCMQVSMQVSMWSYVSELVLTIPNHLWNNKCI